MVGSEMYCAFFGFIRAFRREYLLLSRHIPGCQPIWTRLETLLWVSIDCNREQFLIKSMDFSQNDPPADENGTLDLDGWVPFSSTLCVGYG
jgi:hypothetical protein